MDCLYDDGKNNKEMENLAYKDQLTGAVSFTRFTKLVSMYAQRNVNYSLVSLNMRRFKFMNEILGRDKSDDFYVVLLHVFSLCLKKMKSFVETVPMFSIYC